MKRQKSNTYITLPAALAAGAVTAPSASHHDVIAKHMQQPPIHDHLERRVRVRKDEVIENGPNPCLPGMNVQHFSIHSPSSPYHVGFVRRFDRNSSAQRVTKLIATLHSHGV